MIFNIFQNLFKIGFGGSLSSHASTGSIGVANGKQIRTSHHFSPHQNGHNNSNICNQIGNSTLNNQLNNNHNNNDEKNSGSEKRKRCEKSQSASPGSKKETVLLSQNVP